MVIGAPVQTVRPAGGILPAILRHRFLVAIVAGVLLIAGGFQLRHMPVEILPGFSTTLVEIQTEAPGLSPEEVEQLITVPIEHNLVNGVAWLDRISSESVAGLSVVTLLFQPGTDLYRARQMVAERLSQASVLLPRVSKGPVMLQPKAGTGRTLMVRLASRKLTAIQLSVLARWTLTPRLMGVPGVANVAIWGMRDRQLQVQVDPERLRAHQVSLMQLLESVGNALWVSTLSFLEAATPGNAGFIDTPQQRLGIQHISPIVSPESLARVTVQANGTLSAGGTERERPAPRQGAVVRVLDVADVVEGHPPLIGDALAAEGANLVLVIDKLPGSDTVEVTRGVEAALATLRPGFGDIEADSTIFRPATFIEETRENLGLAVLVALALVVLATGALDLDWRAAVISVISVALSLVVAGLILHGRGATLNVMTVAGLALAVVATVDDSRSMVAGILRRRRVNPAGDTEELGGSSVVDVSEASGETRGALLFANAISLVVFLPVFLLQGIAGDLFRPLAVSYLLAMLASTAVALVFTPALCACLMADGFAAGFGGGVSPLMQRVKAAHERWMRPIVAAPGVVIPGVAVLAGVALGLMFMVRLTWLPTFKERDLLVRLKAAPGTSHPEMVRIVDRMAGELRALPGIRSAVTLVGRAVLGDQAVAVNSAELWVSMAPAADHAATVAAIREVIHGYPGVEGGLNSHINEVAGRLDGESGPPIVVRLYGPDWAILRSRSEALRQGLSAIPGAGEIRVHLPVDEPTLEIEVDLAAASRHGINPGTVRRAASTWLNGIQVGSLFQEQKIFDVVVWSTPRTRSNLSDVNNLLIDTPAGVPVRLGDVARVRMEPRPGRITHEDVSRHVDIGIRVAGGGARRVADEVRRFLKEQVFPLEYHAMVLTPFEQEQSGRNRILAAAGIVLVGVVLLFHAACESWRLAILSCLTLPLALAGGLVPLVLAGPRAMPLGAAFGLAAVFGVAVRNRIGLCRRLGSPEGVRREGCTRDLVCEWARERFRPISMTLLSLAMALLPFWILRDRPGLEILAPMAPVILGGLITCVLVDLLVMPTLCGRITRSSP